MESNTFAVENLGKMWKTWRGYVENQGDRPSDLRKHKPGTGGKLSGKPVDGLGKVWKTRLQSPYYEHKKPLVGGDYFL